MSCLVCIALCCLFSLPPFTRTFWIISLSCINCFTSADSFLSSKHVPVFFLYLIIFVRFLFCYSNRISFQDFELGSCSFGLHRFYHGLILLLHRLVRLIPGYFSLRYVLILRLFFQFLPWQFTSHVFLCNGNLMFFSDLLLFKISPFISSSCFFTVCFFTSCVFTVWFGWVASRLLFFFDLFLLKHPCFSVFDVSIIVLGSCCSHSQLI